MTTLQASHRRAALLHSLLGAAAVSVITSAACAQSAAPSADGVPEITVTARHRTESLQKVPVAVSVVSGAQAAAANLNDIQDISSEVPSVDFRTSASNKDRTVFVRGVGTISTSPSVEPSVSTVIDGVVQARAGQATVDLLDLDHIEVLEGPQGTLFGKNASAGVINIITKSPTNTPSGYLDAGIYEGGEYRVGGGVSGPITDQLQGLLSLFDGQYDGNVGNLANGKHVNGYRHEGGRAKLVAEASPDLKFTFSADYTHSIDTTPTGVWVSSSKVAYPTNVVSPNAALAGQLTAEGITPSANNTIVDENVDSSVHDDNGGASLQADWDFGGGYRLTSITAYRDWRNVQYQDYDELGAPAANLPQVADTGHLSFQQTSQELRIASPKDQFVDYVVGLFALDSIDRETYERDDLFVAGGSTTPGAYSGLAHYGARDLNYAAFGEADVNFTKSFRAIIGFREVSDNLSYYHQRVSVLPVVGGKPAAVTGIATNFAANGSTSQDGQAGRVGLQYDVSQDITTYATYSRGYMGPAYNVFFNMAAVNTPALRPETSNSYEIGLKSNLFDHKLQADFSAYVTDFYDYQANFTQLVAGGLVTNLINAGSVVTQGAEANFIAKPVHGLTLNADLAYDDAHVVSFPCPAGSPVACNINGEPLPFAPRWKTHLEGDYRFPVTSAYDVSVESDYNWQSQVQYQLAETPNTIQPAYGIWNASVAVLGKTNGWTARFLVKNILDQHYSPYLAGGDLGGLVRWVPRDNQRYVGFNLHKDF